MAFVVMPRAALEEEFRLDDSADGLDGVPEEDGLNPVAEPARKAAKKLERKVGRLEGIDGSISPKAECRLKRPLRSKKISTELSCNGCSL